MSSPRTLVWFRSDLRLADNPALFESARRGDEIVGLFVASPEQWRQHDWGEPKEDFARRSVLSLARRLRFRGVPLLLRTWSTFDEIPGALPELARDLGCGTVAWNRELEHNERKRDRRARSALEEAGVEVREFDDQVLFPPAGFVSSSGRPYSIFTPFYRQWASRIEQESPRLPFPEPEILRGARLEEAAGDFSRAESRWSELWPAGEEEAHRRLRRFLSDAVERYHEDRDQLTGGEGSSLSPYLAMGALSPLQALHQARSANEGELGSGSPGIVAWIRQLAWREFYRHVLAGFPWVGRSRSFRREADRIVWREDEEGLVAWQEGRTGFPFVDAGMRELLATGFMHNRLRMITAAFLSKDLLLDWRLGEAHFARHLVDFDHANNNGGWQWAASTGTDAAPYFRIFNPWTQGRRFDPEGSYIRRWVPELRGVPAARLHDPKKLEGQARDYPPPILDHGEARRRALAAYEAVLKSRSKPG